MNIKNIKTKIVLSAFILLSVMGLVGIVNAANPSMYVSPSSLNRNSGSVFNTSIGVSTQGNKVCVIEGTIIFNNLTCQSIVLASDVMAQASPTCSNPYYLIGIPGCTMADKVLLTVAVKAGSAGTASISQSGIDIIGEGVSLGSSSITGNYTINSAPAVTSTPESTSTEQIIQPEPETTEPIQTTDEPTSSINPEQASLVSTGFNFSNYLWIGLILILVIIGGIYFVKKTKK